MTRKLIKAHMLFHQAVQECRLPGFLVFYEVVQTQLHSKTKPTKPIHKTITKITIILSPITKIIVIFIVQNN